MIYFFRAVHLKNDTIKRRVPILLFSVFIQFSFHLNFSPYFLRIFAELMIQFRAIAFFSLNFFRRILRVNSKQSNSCQETRVQTRGHFHTSELGVSSVARFNILNWYYDRWRNDYNGRARKKGGVKLLDHGRNKRYIRTNLLLFIHCFPRLDKNVDSRKTICIFIKKNTKKKLQLVLTFVLWKTLKT